MTDQQFAGVGPAFVGYPGRFRDCFLQKRVACDLEELLHLSAATCNVTVHLLG